MIEDLLCDESFLRYCRGENHADLQQWEAWLRNNPDKQSIVNNAKRLYDVLNLGQGNRLEQLSALKDAMRRQSLFKEQVSHSKPVPLRSRSWLKYAAGIIVLLSVAIFAYMHRNKEHIYYTGANEHKTIMLPDGSTIILNANSRLTVSTEKQRQVAITGEAFFDIQHDAAHPFLVNTEAYTIRVLGTTFNVRSYPGKNNTETTLLTGKIEIVQEHSTPAVVLRPNQKFILAGNNDQPVTIHQGKVVPPVMDTATRHVAETSWARRRMDIKDETFEKIAVELQSWYGIKIRFADDAVKNYRYTATFDDETIFKALRYLQQSYPFTYSIEDDCIVIAGN